MSDTIEVITPGSLVSIGARSSPGNALDGIVSAVQVRDSGTVRYLVVWYSNGSRNEDYVMPQEVFPTPRSGTMRIGFSCPEELQAHGGTMTSHKGEVRR